MKGWPHKRDRVVDISFSATLDLIPCCQEGSRASLLPVPLDRRSDGPIIFTDVASFFDELGSGV
jgi:hypothetical protein